MSSLFLKDSHVTLKDIEEAQIRIKKYLDETALVECKSLADKLNFPGKLLFKLDNQQPTGSFKVRGAFNNILQLTANEAEVGVVARSSGNFSQAVAYASKTLNVPATIVMPPNAPKIKIEGTKKWGAKVLFTNTAAQEEGEELVKKLTEENKYIPLHPYNTLRTLIGQGTAGLEIMDQCNNQNIAIHHFYCPIGGGGLLSGCATAFKESLPTITIHGIEPEKASDYFQSRKQGKRVTIKNIDTIADGLRSSAVGEVNYPLLNKNVDEVDIVTELEIKKAMKVAKDHLGIVIEPSGAVALAGFLKAPPSEGNIVIFISGQNVDKDAYDKWIAEAS